jgi:hypothetical protein
MDLERGRDSRIESIEREVEIKAPLHIALELLLYLLQSEDFAVLTKSDIDSKQDPKSTHISRMILLRCCYPREKALVYIQGKQLDSVVPCRILLREISAEKVRIEISKNARFMEPTFQEAVQLSREVDHRIFALIAKVEEQAKVFDLKDLE